MNRERKLRLRNIRDMLHLAVIEIDVWLDEKEEEPTEDEMGSIPGVPDNPEEYINTTWSAADEEAKESVYMKDLRELTDLKGLTIIGQIKTVFDLKSYVGTDKEGNQYPGLIYRFVLNDLTGDITVIAFDDMATELKQYTIGQSLKITNAWKMQENKNKVLELHVGNYAKIEVVE